MASTLNWELKFVVSFLFFVASINLHAQGPQFVNQDSFNINFEVEEIKGMSYLLVQLDLEHGAYVISPYSEDGFYGPLNVSLAPNPYMDFNGLPIETPKAVEEIDPFLEKPVRLVRSNTIYQQELSLLSKANFEIKGEVFLLLEPACIPYVISYTLIQNDGILRVKENDIRIHESYKK